jgi:hypothetical protein
VGQNLLPASLSPTRTQHVAAARVRGDDEDDGGDEVVNLTGRVRPV